MKIRNEEEDRNYQRLVEQETLIFAVTEAISEVLERENKPRTALAKALGRTKGYVSQLLSGKRNMTLRTAADLAFAVDHRFELDLVPLEEADDGRTLTGRSAGRAREIRGARRAHAERIGIGGLRRARVTARRSVTNCRLDPKETERGRNGASAEALADAAVAG